MQRLRQRFWLAPLTVAAIVAVFGVWGNHRLRTVLEEQVLADLTTTLDANVTALGIWSTNQMNLATALATEPRTRELAINLFDLLASNGTNQPSDLAPARELNALLSSRIGRLGYGMAQIVSTNFQVFSGPGRGRGRQRTTVNEDHIAKYAELFESSQPVLITPFKPRRGPPPNPANRSNDPNQIGETRMSRGSAPIGSDQSVTRLDPPPSDSPRFQGGPPNENPGGLRATPPPFGGQNRLRRGDFTLMQVAAPIHDFNDQVRGALALIINPDREFSKILSVARAGNSGETYAFDENGLMISRSRFDDQLKALGLIENKADINSALNLKLTEYTQPNSATISTNAPTESTAPLIEYVAKSVAGGSGANIKGSKDYRGVLTVGAWKWVPQHGFGVVTQMDFSEAYKPLRVLRTLFVLLFLLLLLSATGMLIFSHTNQIWRQKLSAAELKLQKLGQYALEEKIGEGGMGVVYKARHALMRRDTAIKLLTPDRADPEAVERFEREVRLTCQLAHPNTIQIYDYGHTPDGIFYYAMELLEGLNLHQLISRFGPQPESRVIHILLQICDSLAEAHQRSLIHRDIKPANIFLCDRGGVPDHVKVLDFGLVREYGTESQGQLSLTHGAGLVGTPSFMPPEAFCGGELNDPRLDVYSIGALGYFLVTGRNVFEAKTVVELYHKHQTQLPQPPSRVSIMTLSAQFESAILQCLEKEPTRRPSTILELRTLLERSPTASAWTLASRKEWWIRYRDPSISNPGEAPVSTGSHEDPTVRIDLSSRDVA